MNTNKNENESNEFLEVMEQTRVNSSLAIEEKMAVEFLDRIKEGDIVFSYTKNDNMFQVTIFNNLVSMGNKWIEDPNDYSVSIITKDYSIAFKHVDLDYLKNQVYNKMKEYGADEDILDDFMLMIENIEFEYGLNEDVEESTEEVEE